MKITIDRAGRVVIPVHLREKLGLEAGTELDVEVDNLALRLSRSAPQPEVVEVNGRRVVRPSKPRKSIPDVDIAALVDEERERWPI